jgi:hypothetical protein
VVLARRTRPFQRWADETQIRRLVLPACITACRIRKIPENVGDFRLMDRVVVDALKQLPERQRFMKGLFAWVGFRTVTMDYVRAAAGLGGSHEILRLRALEFRVGGIYQFFSTVPLKIWTYLGAARRACCTLVLCAVHHSCYTLAASAMRVPGYASLLVADSVFRQRATHEHRPARRIYRAHLSGDQAAAEPISYARYYEAPQMEHEAYLTMASVESRHWWFRGRRRFWRQRFAVSG